LLAAPRNWLIDGHPGDVEAWRNNPEAVAQLANNLYTNHNACMIRSTCDRFNDIEQNINLVLDVTKRRSLANFQHDLAFRYTILHALMIIAEAVGHLPAYMTARDTEAPWPKINAIGAIIRDDPRRVDMRFAWEVATVHLEPLNAVVKKLLASIKPTDVAAVTHPHKQSTAIRFVVANWSLASLARGR
jgi:uncharacterized protein with HEPN domain